MLPNVLRAVADDYVTLYRLKCAQELLAKSSLSVSEIAYQCGFKDSSYFVRVFRKHLKQDAFGIQEDAGSGVTDGRWSGEVIEKQKKRKEKSMEERMMFLDIPQMDVFTEDYSSVFSVIENAAKKENGLLELRSSWEILFSAYDDDPREIPDIPEVANWIRKSVSAGVPWLYLLRQEKEPDSSLILFVIICCGEISEDPPGVYIDREQFRQFVDQNFENLEAFVSRYDMPEDLVGQTANDAVECILETLFGKRDDDGAEESGQASVDAEEESGQAFRRNRRAAAFGSGQPRLPAVWTKRTGRRFGTSRLRRRSDG